MNKHWITLVLFLVTLCLNAQVKKDTLQTAYLEDQVYLSLTYNILNNKPLNITQNGFSGGISVGFIRDIPLNRSRTIGLGIGLGYAYNAYIQNLKISRVDSQTTFESSLDFNSNKFSVHTIELPIELRLRNSTLTKFKFWRIYSGVNVSYVFKTKTKFSDDFETIKRNNIPEFQKIQYGISVSAGYGTWNLYVYYGLNKLFKDVDFNGENLKLSDLKIGLKFYMM